MLSLQEWVFPLLQNLQTGCGAHQSPQWSWEGAAFQGKSSQGMKLTTHLYPVLKLRGGAIPLPLLHALMAYTKTNVFSCTMFILDCHLIQCLQISCSTVHLFIFIIMSVYMWNKFFSSIIACSTSLAQSKEGHMECKLHCSIQDVPLLGILLSEIWG
jgi:hypothetical protein